jgi:hypothetical protein
MARITTIPQASAFRLLVQGDDDSDPVEFCLATAARWTTGQRPQILAINATGRDLTAYALRYPTLVQITDDRGRPSRSLTEIGEVLADLPSTVGVVVVLDTNMLYRAARCADKSIDKVKALDAGRWDLVNEALGKLGEIITRSGRPSVYLAPTTDEYGVTEDGQAGKVGTKPHGWKGLIRSAHATVHVSRDGASTNIEVLSDDHRVLGVPGTVRLGMDGGELGRAFEAVARGSAPAFGATLLEENTTAELAARERVARRRVQRSTEMRGRVCSGEARLRACQGSAAWNRLIGQIHEADLLPDDSEAIQACITSQNVQAPMLWSCALEYAADTVDGPVLQIPWGLHGDTAPVRGPSPLRCPPLEGGHPPEWLFSQTPEYQHHALMTAPPSSLVEWVASLAEFAGVWTQGGMAAVSVLAQVPARGPDWEPYRAEELRALMFVLADLGRTRLAVDGPRVEPIPEVVPAVAANEPATAPPDETEEKVLRLIDSAPVVAANEPTRLRVVDGPPPPKKRLRASEIFESPNRFETLDEPQQHTALRYLIDRCRVWNRIEEIVETVGAETHPKHKVRDVRHWPAKSKVAVYRHLLALFDAQDFWDREAS